MVCKSLPPRKPHLPAFFGENFRRQKILRKEKNWNRRLQPPPSPKEGAVDKLKRIFYPQRQRDLLKLHSSCLRQGGSVSKRLTMFKVGDWVVPNVADAHEVLNPSARQFMRELIFCFVEEHGEDPFEVIGVKPTGSGYCTCGESPMQDLRYHKSTCGLFMHIQRLLIRFTDGRTQWFSGRWFAHAPCTRNN